MCRALHRVSARTITQRADTMKLNRSRIIKAVNENLSAKGLDVRIRYNAEWQEFQVTYTVNGTRTFAPADSLTDAIGMVLYGTFNGPAYAQVSAFDKR